MAIPTTEEFTDFDYGLFETCLDEVLGEIYSQCTEEQEFSRFTSPFSSTPLAMSRARHWCFTLNNWTASSIVQLESLGGEVDYLVYGKEVGASGTPHLQGFVSFRTRVRRNQCIAKIGQAHFTVARHIDQAIEYCKKDGDFVEIGSRPRGPGARSDLADFKEAVLGGNLDMASLRDQFSDTVAKYPKFCVDYVNDNMPKKTVEPHLMRPWQQVLNHDLNLPANDRTIVFIVDKQGNQGKSWFAHYYASIHDNAQVMSPGKKADMAYALVPTIRVLFIDAPRSKQGEYLQYDFLEDVKNGYVFSPKYESRVKHLSKVHVVVMMNEHPDMTKLSQDRYDIRELTN